MSNPFINVPTIINTSCSPLKYLARFVINEIDTSQSVALSPIWRTGLKRFQIIEGSHLQI